MEDRKPRYYYGRSKQWHEAFSVHQHFPWYDSYVQEQQKSSENPENSLDVFLGGLEQGVSSIQAEEIRLFCQPSQPQTRGETARRAQRAWLDDREEGTGRTRKYEDRLAAYQLRTLLSQPRLGLSHLPDVDRRLIYIANPDPDYILALVETAPCCELDVLRDTIWKHLAFQTEISVGIRPTGFPLWNLEFHLPYLILTKQPRSSRTHPNSRGQMKVRRKWIDLSFFDAHTPSDRPDDVYGIQTAHVSLLLSGADNFRYTGYLLVNKWTGSNYDDDGDDDAEYEDDSSNEEDDDQISDPLASDCEGSKVIEADRPIWDPREYFFMIVSSRMSIAKSEWAYIVRAIEVRVRKGEEIHGTILMRLYPSATPQKLTEAVHWVTQATYVIEQLRACLYTTTQVWRTFDVENGDIDYFSDLTAVWLHIEMVRTSFRELEKLQTKLDEMQSICKTLHKSLALFMNLDSNRLNLASNYLNSQSYELNSKTVRLNHETNVVALNTHKIIRSAFLINQFFIPIAIAAILFGSEHNTLQLRRDPITFWVCVIGLILLTWLFAVVNHFASHSDWPRVAFKWMRSSSMTSTDDFSDLTQEKPVSVENQSGQMSLSRAYTV